MNTQFVYHQAENIKAIAQYIDQRKEFRCPDIEIVDRKISVRKLLDEVLHNQQQQRNNKKLNFFCFVFKRFIVPSSMHLQHHYRKNTQNKINL